MVIVIHQFIIAEIDTYSIFKCLSFTLWTQISKAQIFVNTGNKLYKQLAWNLSCVHVVVCLNCHAATDIYCNWPWRGHCCVTCHCLVYKWQTRVLLPFYHIQEPQKESEGSIKIIPPKRKESTSKDSMFTCTLYRKFHGSNFCCKNFCLGKN